MLSTATVNDLAEAAAVPETVIWRWIRTGRLHPVPTAKRTRDYQFPVAAIDQARRLGEARRLLKGSLANEPNEARAASQATG